MQIAISLLGGLGLFLYGMNMMGDGLQKSAGEQLKKIIGFLTSNVVMGVLVGAVVTGIIQSSSATTVMVVGFVNAGIMSLSQAIGVIMGANIGTTVTAQLVSFKLEDIARRMYVRDTLDGEKMQEEINDLKMLLLAYKKGLIKEK